MILFQKKGHSVDSSYISVNSNNHQQKKIITGRPFHHNYDEETIDNNVLSENALSTHSLFDVDQQRKTSISFDKIKQLTLALSIPSGEDLDIAPIDPQNVSTISDQKIDYGNCDEYSNERTNDNLNYKILSSSSSAEEPTSEYIGHQNEPLQCASRDHSSSSLLNTPVRERQSTSFTKLDHPPATKLASAPDNEQDSGLESEFGLNESMATRDSKFNSREFQKLRG